MGKTQEINTIFTKELQALIQAAEVVRMGIKNGLMEKFPEFNGDEYKVAFFSRKKKERLATFQQIKKINALCGMKIESLNDVFKFTSRLKTIFKKTPEAIIVEFQVWKSQWEQSLGRLIEQRDEFAKREEIIINTKINLLYHTLGELIECLYQKNNATHRSEHHRRRIAELLSATNLGKDLGVQDPQPAKHCIDEYQTKILTKIKRMEADEITHSTRRFEREDEKEEKNKKLEEKYKTLLNEESQHLIKLKIKLDIVRYIHLNCFHSMERKNKLRKILYSAILHEFAFELKFNEKITILIERLKTNRITPVVKQKFANDLLEAMYEDGGIEINKDYFSHKYVKNNKLKKPQKSDQKNDKSQDEKDDELLAIPDLIQFRKKQRAEKEAQDNDSSIYISKEKSLASSLESYSEFVDTDHISASELDEEAEFSNKSDMSQADDVLGVCDLASNLKSYSQYVDSDTVNLSADDVKDDVYRLFTNEIEINDFSSLPQYKIDYIFDLQKVWKNVFNRIADRFVTTNSDKNVFDLFDKVSNKLSINSNHSFSLSDPEYHYVDLVKFAKNEIDDADPYTDASLHARLKQLFLKSKVMAKNLVNKILRQENKDRSAAELAGFISAGIVLSIVLLCGLILGNVIMLTSIASLALHAALFMVGGAVAGFIIKKAKDGLAYLLERCSQTEQYEPIVDEETSTSINTQIHREIMANAQRDDYEDRIVRPTLLNPSKQTVPLYVATPQTHFSPSTKQKAHDYGASHSVSDKKERKLH